VAIVLSAAATDSSREVLVAPVADETLNERRD
jgi:hypothetical protein